MRFGTCMRETLPFWMVLLALFSSCGESEPKPSLVGTVVYDDSFTRAEMKIVPLVEATVFVTVKDNFRAPSAESSAFTLEGSDEDSPEGRRVKAIQELVRSQPADFFWDGYRPHFGGELGVLYEAQVDEDGRFSLDTLPSGQHMLTVCYKVPLDGGKPRRSMARKISVRDGYTTELDVALTRFDVVDL